MVARIPLYVCMDAKTVFDCLEGDNMPGDRRVAIDIACLRESLLEENNSGVRWLPGPQQPGDELTKIYHNGRLSDVVKRCRFSLVETPEVRMERERLRAERKRKEVAKVSE